MGGTLSVGPISTVLKVSLHSEHYKYVIWNASGFGARRFILCNILYNLCSIRRYFSVFEYIGDCKTGLNHLSNEIALEGGREWLSVPFHSGNRARSTEAAEHKENPIHCLHSSLATNSQWVQNQKLPARMDGFSPSHPTNEVDNTVKTPARPNCTST